MNTPAFASSHSHSCAFRSYEGIPENEPRRARSYREPLLQNPYKNPMEFFIFTSLEELNKPFYSTMQCLRDLKPQNKAAKKAKNFWLKHAKYSLNPEERERIRETYPVEVAHIQKLIYLHSTLNDAECSLSLGYSKRAPQDIPEIPAEFSSLDYYLQLEPDDRFGYYETSLALLNFFLDVPAARCLQSFSFTTENFQLIETRFPEKCGRLRELLWHRHLSLVAQRVEEAERFAPERLRYQTEADRIAKIATAVASTVSFIAGAVFASVAIALSLPIWFIPAAVSVCISIGSITAYFLTRN